MDEPLQLIEFIRADDKPNADIKLKYDSLDKVLKRCGDRPISILCICGPSRMGKSFVLGYMIRCLEALEKGDTDWMGWEDKKRPLEGFKFRNGSAPETKGIWMWSRPFNIKTDEGKEVSVLLLDTQGTQDEFTSTKDMSAIVGLSLLMSSTLIFNFFNNLQEDVLVALNTYIQYGLLALENSGGEKAPFQKLNFLIRDWNNPDEYAFGGKGGKKFIEDKLDIKPGQPKEAQELRQTIRKCFQQLDCFLMPHIGQKALYKDFKGSVSELDILFAKKLDEFISSLISTENITIKEILGNPLSAMELKSYLDMYVETFNSEEIPSACNMLEATSKVHNTIQVQNAVRKYQEHLKKKMRGKGNYLSSDDLQTAHEESEKAAKDAFKKMKKYGNAGTIQEYSSDLENQILQQFELAKTHNEDKRKTFIAQEKNDAISTFRGKLYQEFPLSEENETEFYEVANLTKAEKQLRSEVTVTFEENLSNENEESMKVLVQSLHEILRVSFDNFQDKNKAHRSNAESLMRSIVKDLHADYKTKVGNYLNSHKFEELEKLREFHEDIKAASLESLKEIKKPGCKDFHKTFHSELEAMTVETFRTMESELKNDLHEIWKGAEVVVKKEAEQYLTDLRAVSQNEDCLEVEYLQNAHQDEYPKFIEKLQEQSPYPDESKYHQKLTALVKQELDSVYQTVCKELEDFLRISEERRKAVMAESVEHYKNGMKKLFDINNGTFVEDDVFQETHDRLLEEALERFEAVTKTGPVKNQNIAELSLNELKTNLKELFEKVKEDLESKKETAKLKSTNLVNECRSEYEHIMKTAMDDLVRTEKDLEAAHERAKEAVVKMFKEQCPVKRDEFMAEYLESLVEDVDEAYEDYVELFDMKRSETCVKLEKLLIECRQSYITEMEKQCSSEFFIKPDHLQALHGNCKRITLRKLEQGHIGEGGLTKVQREDLSKEMDSLLNGYSLKNDMKLNFGMGVEPAIGIDLGTTYSCVGVFYNGKVMIIPNVEQDGNLTTPSYVGYATFNSDGTEVVGDPAKKDAYKNPEHTIYDAKRIIGRKMNDPVLQEDMKLWPFMVKEHGGVPKIEANGKLLYPEQVSGKLLSYFRGMAEKYLQLKPGTIKKAVITVPAYFNDGQRQATVDAGRLAGLDVLTILNEPTAAAIAYSLERLENKAKKVLIYDLGGGTFDVAVLNMASKEIEVLGVEGDTHLGGEDFDKNVMTYCAQQFKAKQGIDLFEGKDSSDKRKRDEARRRLRRLQTYCEVAKKNLATARTTKVSVDAMANGIDLEVELTRDKFEELNDTLFKKTIDIVDRALKTVKVAKEEIDDIVLVGGSSRIKKVQELLETYFGGKALNHSIHPDLAVGYGAAVKAAMMNGEQAKGFIDLSQIQDVTPLSLGTEIVTGELSVIIPKNTRIPCRKMGIYITVDHNQTWIRTTVFQGEDFQVARNNELLGEFVLKGIPPGPPGKEKIQTWMEIDSMGILHVESICKSSGRRNNITITENKQRMSKETIDRLLAESA